MTALKPHTRVIVMGTPGFVLPTLGWMIDATTEDGEPQFDLVAIYTRAPKPNSRGMKLVFSPVHKAALELQKTYRLPFEIETPETFRDPKNIERFKSFKPDLVVVGAYGLILPKEILETPPMGCLNLHASLLPEGRGASPIQRAIWEGKKRTGLTIMLMNEGCDTGRILGQESVEIYPGMTAQTLCKNLSEIGPFLLKHVLYNNPEGREQDESKATYAKKITKQEAQIDWNSEPDTILQQIWALSPTPGAFTFIRDNAGKYYRLKIYNGKVCPLDNKQFSSVDPTSDKKNGLVLHGKKLVVGCRNGAIEITDLQLESKNRMKGTDLMNGGMLKAGSRLLNADLVLQQLGKNKKKIAEKQSPTFWRIVSALIPRRGRPQKAAADSQPRPMRDNDR